MKASKQDAAGILVHVLLSAGVLSWGLLSFHGIDLVSEPFGSMMVLSRTALLFAALAVGYQLRKMQAALAHQAVRVRRHRRTG